MANPAPQEGELEELILSLQNIARAKSTKKKDKTVIEKTMAWLKPPKNEPAARPVDMNQRWKQFMEKSDLGDEC